MLDAKSIEQETLIAIEWKIDKGIDRKKKEVYTGAVAVEGVAGDGSLVELVDDGRVRHGC